MNIKMIVTGVTILLIGLSIIPSIQANIVKNADDGEMVEFITEFCGINNVKPYTVKLNKQESIKVEKLINSIKERLDKVETREETEEILNEAVVELEKYGLLGGLSVKQAQRLVTGKFQNSRFMTLLEKIYNRNR